MLRIKGQELTQTEILEEQLRQVELQCQQWKEQLLKQCNFVLNELDIFTTTPDLKTDEATQVFSQLKRQEQLKRELGHQLREARVRQESSEIIKAWEKKRGLLTSVNADTFPPDSTPLYLWYLKLRQTSAGGSKCDGLENKEHKGTILTASDKICYNLKYENASQSPLPAGSSRDINRASRAHPLLPLDWREKLSFNTRRNGFCVHIVAGKFTRSSSKNEQAQLCDDLSDERYIVRCDPHIDGLEERFIENLNQRREPSSFIKHSVWCMIDSCAW